MISSGSVMSQRQRGPGHQWTYCCPRFVQQSCWSKSRNFEYSINTNLQLPAQVHETDSKKGKK